MCRLEGAPIVCFQRVTRCFEWHLVSIRKNKWLVVSGERLEQSPRSVPAGSPRRERSLGSRWSLGIADSGRIVKLSKSSHTLASRESYGGFRTGALERARLTITHMVTVCQGINRGVRWPAQREILLAGDDGIERRAVAGRLSSHSRLTPAPTAIRSNTSHARDCRCNSIERRRQAFEKGRPEEALRFSPSSHS